MNLIWNNEAWEEYVQWQKQDKKMVKKINEIIKDYDDKDYLDPKYIMKI